MSIKGEMRLVRLQRTRGDISMVETMDGEPYGKHWMATELVEDALSAAANTDVIEEARAVVAEVDADAASGDDGEVEEASGENGEGETTDDLLAGISIEDLSTVKPSWYKGLREAGFETARDVAESGADGLTVVNGIGPPTAAKIYDEVSELE